MLLGAKQNVNGILHLIITIKQPLILTRDLVNIVWRRTCLCNNKIIGRLTGNLFGNVGVDLWDL